MLKLSAAVLVLVGLGVAFQGFVAHAGAENILQQLYGSMWLIGGLLILGAGVIVAGISVVADRLKAPPASRALGDAPYAAPPAPVAPSPGEIRHPLVG